MLTRRPLSHSASPPVSAAKTTDKEKQNPLGYNAPVFLKHEPTTRQFSQTHANLLKFVDLNPVPMRFVERLKSVRVMAQYKK